MHHHTCKIYFGTIEHLHPCYVSGGYTVLRTSELYLCIHFTVYVVIGYYMHMFEWMVNKTKLVCVFFCTSYSQLCIIQ